MAGQEKQVQLDTKEEEEKGGGGMRSCSEGLVIRREVGDEIRQGR